MEKLKLKSKTQEPVTPLPTLKEKEAELDSLLSAEEEANYDRIKKQGKSDEIDDEVVDVAKSVYRKGKSAVKDFVKGAVKGTKDSIKGIARETSDIVTGKKDVKSILTNAKDSIKSALGDTEKK